MNTPTLSDNFLREFTCSLEKDSLNKTYYELLDFVFGSADPRSCNVFNFSHAFSKAIEDLILSSDEIDQSRTLLICVSSHMGSVQITLRYQPAFEGVESVGGANDDEVSINFPITKLFALEEAWCD